MHIAIIMDGNGRWATHRGLPRAAGHAEGAKSVRTVVEAAAREGIDTLTLNASDGAVAAAQQTLNINVTSSSAPSLTAGDIFETVDGINGQQAPTSPDSIFNHDSDSPGATLTVTAVGAAPNNGGTFTADGTFGEIVVNETTTGIRLTDFQQYE